MKFKADMTEAEKARYKSLCAFTEQELAVFEGRTSGKSIVEMSITLRVSTSTVSRRIRSIKSKMDRV